MDIETIYGEVVAKANHYQAVPDKDGGRRIIKDDAIRAYERTFAEQCTKYRNKAINVPFKLFVRIYYRNMQHDLDNSIKTILDCLQYNGAITNDVLCMQIVAEKHSDPKRPRIEFALTTQQMRLF